MVRHWQVGTVLSIDNSPDMAIHLQQLKRLHCHCTKSLISAPKEKILTGK